MSAGLKPAADEFRKSAVDYAKAARVTRANLDKRTGDLTPRVIERVEKHITELKRLAFAAQDAAAALEGLDTLIEEAKTEASELAVIIGNQS